MKQTIYVVDDQSTVLDMTVLVLGRLGPDWEVRGFNDPLAALEAVKSKAPNAVLSDQVMPGMEGSELLEQVRLVSPSTIRFIMSGCVAMSKLTLITSAHQYIAKPFDPTKMRDLIQRSFAAQERMKNQGLERVATSIRSIPSLPQAHHSLLEELEDHQSPSETIAKLIGADPGLSTKILQLANSGLFGHGYLVTDLTDAVSCLGTDLITAVLLSQSVFRHYERLHHRDMDLVRLWAHCWETACIAQRLCQEKKLPRQTGEEAFLAGLMHEIGRFILVDNFPDEFQAACDAAREHKAPLNAMLREGFKASPSQLSAYILELWGLPASVVSSITLLENPAAEKADAFSMASALYVADQIASRTAPADSYSMEDWNRDYLEAVGCAGDLPGWEKQFARA